MCQLTILVLCTYSTTEMLKVDMIEPTIILRLSVVTMNLLIHGAATSVV